MVVLWRWDKKKWEIEEKDLVRTSLVRPVCALVPVSTVGVALELDTAIVVVVEVPL
jgi:hypothetical protein